MKKTMHVCPKCYSPYLSAYVLATAQVDDGFQWVLGYEFPDDIKNTLIEHDAQVDCENCEWDGVFSELIDPATHGLDGIQYDTPRSEVIVNHNRRPWVTMAIPIPPHKSKIPEIHIGDVLTISDADDEASQWLGKVFDIKAIPCEYLSETGLTEGIASLFSIVEMDNTIPNGFYIYTGSELANLYYTDKLTITSHKQIEVQEDPNNDDEESTSDLDVLGDGNLRAFA